GPRAAGGDQHDEQCHPQASPTLPPAAGARDGCQLLKRLRLLSLLPLLELVRPCGCLRAPLFRGERLDGLWFGFERRFWLGPERRTRRRRLSPRGRRGRRGGGGRGRRRALGRGEERGLVSIVGPPGGGGGAGGAGRHRRLAGGAGPGSNVTCHGSPK